MNCKFKFHLRAAIHRGAAGPVGLRQSGRAGRRSRWGSACGWDPFYCFAHPPSSRMETDFIGFAGRRARTAPACEPRSDEKRCTEGSVSASVHLFPLLFFQKERIDDELTLSPRRRQFPPLLRDRSKLEVFHEYLYGGSQQRFRSNSYS